MGCYKVYNKITKLEIENVSDIRDSYFLTMTSFQPLYGKFSDIFGRKSALLFAYTTFGLGCLFCAVARNMGELVAARVFASASTFNHGYG